jgi:hypothetical protein
MNNPTRTFEESDMEQFPRSAALGHRPPLLYVGVSVVVLLFSAVLVAGSNVARSSELVPLSGMIVDAEEDCLEPRPEAASLAGITDDGHEVSVEVLVLLDGVSKGRGKKIMDLAARPYIPLEITLRSDFRKMPIRAGGSGGSASPPLDKQVAIDKAKAFLGGSRPSGTDVVYVLTDKIIEGASGFADCIGGVRYPTRAFAVGEDWNNPEDEVVVGTYDDLAAKIAAHEIGHLLGAHHHYSNCAEGASADDLRDGKPASCTLMFGYLDVWSFTFGALESAVIRGHAMKFADH